MKKRTSRKRVSRNVRRRRSFGTSMHYGDPEGAYQSSAPGPGTQGWHRFGGLYRSGDYAFDGVSPFVGGDVLVWHESRHAWENLGHVSDIDGANGLIARHVRPNGRTRRKSKRTSRRPKRSTLRPNLHKTKSGKTILRPTSLVYTERVKFPKWNIRPSATDEPRLLKSRLHGWTKQDHIDAALWNAKMAARIEKAWGAELRRGIAKYGQHGPMISGGFHEDWPEGEKEKVRKLARTFNGFQDVMFAHAAQVRGMKDHLSHGAWREFAAGEIEIGTRSKRNSRRRR